jgi:uncharacterized protein YraI
VLRQTIGGNQITVYDGPGQSYQEVGTEASGVKLEIQCYRTGPTVSGPYGSENIWDALTVGYFDGGLPAWIPDALVYTGTNSAVVPSC